MSIIGKIPTSLSRHARSLEDLGLNEVAWPSRVVSRVLQALQASGAAVLGGDVYAEEGGTLRPLLEGWHCDRLRGESVSAYVRRSWKEASEYVNRYPRIPHRDVYFVLVVDDQGPSGVP